MLSDEHDVGPDSLGDGAVHAIAGAMRLLLFAAALLKVVLFPAEFPHFGASTWFVFYAYACHSALLLALFGSGRRQAPGRVIPWLDMGWYSLIVAMTGGADSFFYPFYYYAILIAAFRWGFAEAARLTLASAGLYLAIALTVHADAVQLHVVARTLFLLTIGYLIAYCGEMDVIQKQRLALLREVSRMSNPRFGVDHTITSMLGRTLAFYDGSCCILLMRDTSSGQWSLRTLHRGEARPAIHAVAIDDDAASAMMQFTPGRLLLYTTPGWPARRAGGHCHSFDPDAHAWDSGPTHSASHVADLLDARSFICTPVSLRTDAGRMYVVAQHRNFSRSDALFLGHLAAQAFPAIKNIELLDRMASDAAYQERQKIARDLHDSTIQPYIGLAQALGALRRKASADNPLRDELEQLSAMTGEVVSELRSVAGTFRRGRATGEHVFLAALRQQADTVKRFYGIDIAVGIEGELTISDRLAAEVFQLLSEGMSNIRKHTSARHGLIQLRCNSGWLTILIENECDYRPVDFVPRSITERTIALGGSTRVEHRASGSTAIHVDIPV